MKLEGVCIQKAILHAIIPTTTLPLPQDVTLPETHLFTRVVLSCYAALHVDAAHGDRAGLVEQIAWWIFLHACSYLSKMTHLHI